jgi:enoyl-CoA hydratase
MPHETVLYEKEGRIATVTLNRPEKYNTIRPPMPEELEKAIAEANADSDVKVIILQGAGKAFCAGFDFSGNLEHFEGWGGMTTGADRWDPGIDMMTVTSPFVGPIPKFMSIWRSPKPVIARVHGWCVGGGTDMALLADVIIATEDARFGTPYSRVWGCYLTGLWIYRLGLTKVKLLALTGDSISGKEAEEFGLINKAYPYDNMGLMSTQLLGCILDGYMRNIPEGLDFVKTAMEQGVGAAVKRRDEPFGDYSQAPPELRPSKMP